MIKNEVTDFLYLNSISFLFPLVVFIVYVCKITALN